MTGVAANRRIKSRAFVRRHRVVIGDWAVPWVGEPEVLPDHDAVAVACFVKCVVADLADPVADHGEVHLAVVAHRGVVLASAIAQHRFAEAPVAAARDEAAAIDPDAKRFVVFVISELPHAGFEGGRVGTFGSRFRMTALPRRDEGRHTRPATIAPAFADAELRMGDGASFTFAAAEA